MVMSRTSAYRSRHLDVDGLLLLFLSFLRRLTWLLPVGAVCKKGRQPYEKTIVFLYPLKVYVQHVLIYILHPAVLNELETGVF